jgi:hypothetical protein
VRSLVASAQLNGRLKESDALSLNDFFVKAAALALRKVRERVGVCQLLHLRLRARHASSGNVPCDMVFPLRVFSSTRRQVPEVNSSWLADSIRSYQYVDISVSMGISDGV